MAAHQFPTEPVAVIGTSCRFPGGASSPSKLWHLLEKPHNIVKEIPVTRFNTEGFYHDDGEHHGSTNIKHAYLLEEDHRTFDHNFFSISPREAETMDPQMRIVLETVYESIESAGYSTQKLRGSSTSVFLGMMNSDFMHQLYRDLDNLPQYACTGMTMSIMANRISYFFDWHGPSVAIDTACSSSMVSLHQAVQALRNGESKVAIAAGMNIILGPELFIAESKLHMLSPNGRSHMWDAGADGYTRGEGFAAVVLKTLSEAIKDGDHIECIIRETGVNQDGRTPGITMPSASAQASLIRSTYARCGLDINAAYDRPQFFEAHGTGTPAGDPIEAEAIHRAFFPNNRDVEGHEKLPVGSIKTIIGHLEGTAGLAGLIKGSLALQRGILPPNLHFHQLNPNIQPFYDQLYIPTSATPWPMLPQGVPRRVSVNSFGFGGTNGHAILESWPQDQKPQPVILDSSSDTCAYGAGPFVLSANSNQSLVAMAAALSAQLKAEPGTDLTNLAFTLSRRSEFPYRASFAATSVKQLADELDSFEGVSTRALAIPESLPLRILGVFTGQGAQWPAMGKELYDASAVYRESMQQMQRALDELPDGPSWSLIEQLFASPETSRIHEAALSQPLCTAVQVAMVKALQAAGISFSAVVGHSSGEIGAAFAAGYLSAPDAIRIAYYRGVHAKMAHGPQGQKGKMMAVSLSLEQATAFCKDFDATYGKISVAASNSLLSCTLAGDADAIDEAKRYFDGQGTFARTLKVDTAYHSHHMQPCSEPYLDSIRRCNITIQDGPPHCAWYSSVYGSDGRWRTFDASSGLSGQYWVDNMTKPVLFSQAIQRAVSEEHCHDLVLEIGPHPSLKGPSSEVIKTLTSRSLPYSGVLERGQNSLKTFARALSLVWDRFLSPRPLINFDNIRRSFLGADSTREAPTLAKNLPPYCWDHETVLWKETRRTKAFRTRGDRISELLGHHVSNGEREKREMRWRQILKVNEIPWARGHVFQGQVLFPASGYLAMAYEAAVRLVEDQAIRLVELHNVKIHRAMTLDENSSGTDVTFTIRITGYAEDRIMAEYSCFSATVDATQQDNDLVNCTGQVDVLLGPCVADALPSRVAPTLPMEDIEADQLYSSLSEIGLDYSGDFRAESVKRRHNQATVTIRRPATPSSFRIHPGTLDVAIHSVFAAFAFPGDGRLWSAYLPSTVDRVRFNMAYSEGEHTAPSSLVVADTVLTDADARKLVSDVDLFCAADGYPEIQMRGLNLKTFASPQPEDDRRLYTHHEWMRDPAYGVEPSQRVSEAPDARALNEACVRSAYYYLRRLNSEINAAEIPGFAFHHQHLVKFVQESLLPRVESGTYPDVSPQWASDTADMLDEWRARYPESIDLKLAQAVGDNLLDIVRGKVPPLQVMMQDSMLDRLYTEGIGFREANHDLAVLAGQLAHRHTKMKILEVGAGTGGATSRVLPGLQGRFASYTYTDISPGFFEKARQIFGEYAEKMIFQTLNIEKDPLTQGYKSESFDLIIASNVLHATRRLEDTMRNCRRLLRPGGHIMLLEITRETLPAQLMGTLPGWFLGVDDGRVWAPTISEDAWDGVLSRTGFSGLDTSTTSFFSVMMSQATDDAMTALREPLAASVKRLPPIADLVVIGGDSSSSPSLIDSVMELLSSKVGTFTLIPSLDDIKGKGIHIPSGAAILSLSDLSSPVFRDMQERRFQGLQEIVRSNAHAVLWITQGAVGGDDPIANMIVGWGRCMLNESPNTKLQFLDLDRHEAADAKMLSEMLLRLVCAGHPGFDHLLSTVEHELKLVDGAMYIPRVCQSTTLNHRYNSERRMISERVTLQDGRTSVEITERNGGVELQQSVTPTTSNGTIRIDVAASSACPYICSDGQQIYVYIGSVAESGEKVVTLSHAIHNSSAVNVSASDLFYLPEGAKGEEDAEKLFHLLAAILAESILAGGDDSIWVHGASESLSHAIRDAAGQRGVDVFFSTSDSRHSGPSTHFIHPCISKRNLEMVRPLKVSAFVNLQQPINYDFDRTVRSCLPSTTITFREATHVSKDGVQLSLALPVLRHIVKNHLDRVPISPPGTSPSSGSGLPQAHVIDVSHVHTIQPSMLHPAAVIDWRALDTVSVKVHPLHHDGLFSGHKTYLLIGLSGDLGLSIAEWMVNHGARYIVISSRSPKVPQSFIEHIERKGAELRIVALDVADRAALHRVYNDIKATMPPVGGVMNGAMVLRDRSFVNTSWADFAAVLAPKVQGSQYLDELFHDTELEFMIFFSSLVSIVGNAGQASYAAANLFMTSLASQRRRRGVPASVLHIGMVIGVGYVHHSESRAQYEAQLMRNGCVVISEADLHEMMAEAIVCGRPDSAGPADLIAGLQKVSTAAWINNPRFALDFNGEAEKEKEKEKEKGTEQGTGNQGQQRKQKAESVAKQLEATKDEGESLKIIQQSLVQSLGGILQMSVDQIDVNVSPSSLGIDSLVAVQVRTWFLKEVGVDVPVLKFLGDNTIAQLCRDALAARRRAQDQPQKEARGAKAAARIDWNKELSSLLAGVQQLLPTQGATDGVVSTSDGQNGHASGLQVVLTGATGVLGTSILRKLIADDRVSVIHCIAIRPEASGKPRKLEIRHPKISEYTGDLTEKRLGLSAADFTQLARCADVIIHNGAQVRFLQSYGALRAANVGSTQTLLAMATPRHLPLHFVSTGAVALFVDESEDSIELPEISAAHTPPPADIETDKRTRMGYSASKWASEVLLERARDIPAVVHRAVAILGPDAPPTDLVSAIERYSTQLRAVPSLDGRLWPGLLDIVDAEDVADGIVADALGGTKTAQPFTVRNYCAEEKAGMEELQQFYARKMGREVAVWPLEKWLEGAASLGMNKVLRFFIQDTYDAKKLYRIPSLRKGVA